MADDREPEEKEEEKKEPAKKEAPAATEKKYDGGPIPRVKQ